VLTRAQALSAGTTDQVIATNLKRGRWQRLYPGVYATFNGVPDADCLLWAAVLRAGPHAVLSHQTEARLWGISGPATAAIHVTVPRGSPVTPAPGLIVHYSQRVTQARHPTATPPRTTVEETALDLASAAGAAEDAVAWILRFIASRRTTADQLAVALRRRRRMRWRAEVSYAVDPANSGVHSILEYRFVNRVERPHGLPAGTRQRLARRGRRTQYSDVAYEDYATLVELDGRAAHPESSRDLDTRRDNANVADGWVTLRYGWIEVSEHSCEIAAQLALTLRRRGWPGSLRRCSATCRIPPTVLPALALPAQATPAAPPRPQPPARPTPARQPPARPTPARQPPACPTPARTQRSGHSAPATPSQPQPPSRSTPTLTRQGSHSSPGTSPRPQPPAPSTPTRTQRSGPSPENPGHPSAVRIVRLNRGTKRTANGVVIAGSRIGPFRLPASPRGRVCADESRVCDRGGRVSGRGRLPLATRSRDWR
jgi:hypothetical protein